MSCDNALDMEAKENPAKFLGSWVLSLFVQLFINLVPINKYIIKKKF